MPSSRESSTEPADSYTFVQYSELVQSRPTENPPNRFHDQSVTYDDGEAPPPSNVTLIDDHARSILSHNDSPDLGFRWSANPYRGCQHACAYCYARPTHEYLDLGAGTDFDTKIVIKRDAAALLREAFDKPSWQGELVMFSGVTDCYQPVERDLELTRRCLEVCLEYRNPVSVISKSALVERDIDLFHALTEHARFGLSVSLAFSDNASARAIEPWAPSPDRRFKLIETLAKAGVPVGVMCAPIIPGVNDSQMVTVLERAAAAGATWAGWVLLRLPGAVKQVFEDRVRVALPLAADKILHRIRETRGGDKLYDARFGTRGRGEGVYAQMLQTMFDTTVARLGLNQRSREGAMFTEAEAPTTFRRPIKPTKQLSLF
jgi:DNA repair photolyase